MERLQRGCRGSAALSSKEGPLSNERAPSAGYLAYYLGVWRRTACGTRCLLAAFTCCLHLLPASLAACFTYCLLHLLPFTDSIYTEPEPEPEPEQKVAKDEEDEDEEEVDSDAEIEEKAVVVVREVVHHVVNEMLQLTTKSAGKDVGVLTWNKVECTGTVPCARFGHKMCCLPDGRIVMTGGVNAYGDTLEDAYVFHPTRMEWQLLLDRAVVEEQPTKDTICTAGGLLIDLQGNWKNSETISIDTMSKKMPLADEVQSSFSQKSIGLRSLLRRLLVFSAGSSRST